MQFWTFYGQPSCTPGRAAMITGRIPNRSGMTTVAFQGQGGGLPAAEGTTASVLQKAGYNTYFTGKWHLGESDYAMPTADGFDKMDNVILYHLNAFTYSMPSFHPKMTPDQLDFFKKSTKGVLKGVEGKPVGEVTAVTEENIGVLDVMMMANVLPEMERLASDKKNPFFMTINFAKNHQPNIPAKKFKGSSDAKTDYADCVNELDTHIGQILAKKDELDIAENTLIIYTVDNGAWQDVYPDCGYTPFRGTKGTDREGGSRVPAFAVWKGVIEPGSDNFDIVGGLDFMKTFASLASEKLPEKDRAGEPTVFDSYDMTPLFTGEGEYKRNSLFYFTERELMPGAIRLGCYKLVFNMRGDNGAVPGSDGGALLGWTGPDKYIATVPQVFDLMKDPQERYDVFMTTFEENTWMAPFMTQALEDLAKSYAINPPRPVQSVGYSGPVSITRYLELKEINSTFKKEGEKYKVTE